MNHFEVTHGIVLRIGPRDKRYLIVFDALYGKRVLRWQMSETVRAVVGGLISYRCYQFATTWYITHCELIAWPAVWAQDDLAFLHRCVALVERGCMWHVRDEHIVQCLYNLYETFSVHLDMVKKVMLASILYHAGIFACALVDEYEMIRLISMLDDIRLDTPLDHNCMQWLDVLIHQGMQLLPYQVGEP